MSTRSAFGAAAMSLADDLDALTQGLQPGQVISYNVEWAGRTSAPGCPGSRDAVP